MQDQEDRYAMANEAINKTEAFFSSIGIPNNLSALNIDDKHIDEMAEHALAFNQGFDKCPRPLYLEDIKQIYRNAL